MFDFFKATAEWWLVGLLLVLLIGPVFLFLIGSWVYRRNEICEGLSPSSVDVYFKTFHKGLKGSRDFLTFYNSRFGRYRYLVPTLVLVVEGWVILTWVATSILVGTGLRGATVGLLPVTAVFAFAGAYVWVVFDLITKWRFRDLAAADLWWSSWRFVAAIPLAYAVGALLQPELAGPMAFVLGAFPTRQVSTIARRLARRQLGLGADVDEKSESELEKLQGIDTRIAERFAEEGITTIGQLAYADPVELTMRCASLAFSFVMDCQNQSLAWIYLEALSSKLRPLSLRGAQEIANLVSELDGDDEQAKTTARNTLNAAAQVVSINQAALERTLREIADDPYTVFLNTVWIESTME
jgi:hypothetical protein